MTRLPQPPPPEVLTSAVDEATDLHVLPAATRLVRLFFAGGRHPQRWNSFRHVGPLPHAFFDPHPPTADGLPARDDDSGVLYFSLSLRTSIAEVFQATGTVDRRTRSPQVVMTRPRRALRLLDLTGLWPTKVGASQAIWQDDTERTQTWARAIRAAMPELDGLWYRSGVDAGNPALCLWDPPASSALPSRPDVLHPLDHAGLALSLGRAAQELNYSLLEDTT